MLPAPDTRIDTTRPGTPAWRSSLVEATATLLAAIATLLCALAIAPGPGPAVLAVVLSISLSRSQLDRDLRGRLEAALMLPLVGLVALAVGLLLHRVPWLGALVFVAGMSFPIWLRRFGPMARRAGSLVALPFVTLLTVPHVQAAPGGRLPVVLVPVVVALLALLWVTLCHLLVRRLHGRRPPESADPVLAAPVVQGDPRLPASTRMAIQMAVALAAAFAVGFLCFGERWAWIVLTAFIVNSGNRGRLDVAYKSGLRVLGAAAGTVLAMAFSMHAAPGHATTAVLILAALFLGIWLRPLGYAWWALFVTVALALLQGFGGGSPAAMLWQRLGEIAIGAVIGLASAWFVWPVRSTDVLRRRLADALAALSEALDPTTPARGAQRFEAALEQLETVAPPFRALRRLTRRQHAMQPADWVDALAACREPAVALISEGATPGEARRAVGAARKALREPEALLPALRHLRETLRG
ncbi:FUSC family protein [Dyella sedimenti]|uniref:FUSC family protein n=1 Tax=Dyella sedimenti TaxID=2919947 RepID=UPI001FA978EB|nr:FUSC family protein [Dyella sedimenti]